MKVFRHPLRAAAPHALACAAAAFTVLITGAYHAASAAPPVVMSAPSAAPAAAFTPTPIVPVDSPVNKLHLTTAQQNKNNAIMGAFYQKRNAIISNKKQTPAQMQSAYVALARSTHAQMLAVLTPDQKKTLAASQAQQAKYITAARAAYSKAMQYSQQLSASLSPAEKTKIKTIGQAAAAQFKTMVSNQKLTIQQRMEQQSALHNTEGAQIRAVLTPAQQTILDSFTRYSNEAQSLARLAQSSGV